LRPFSPCASRPDCWTPKQGSGVLALSEGIMVRICRLLEVAAVQAIRSGAERIELASLSEELLTKTLVSIADRRSSRATA
jgi:hypothetical protein